MNTKITKVNENTLLGRKDVKVDVEHEGEATPAKDDVKNRIAAENDINEDEIEVKNILTGFGKQKSVAILKIYEDFEYDEELEEETIKEDEESVQISEEVKELVEGTITDVKSELEDSDESTLKEALEAEKQNKNRTTLTEWLENQI